MAAGHASEDKLSPSCPPSALPGADEMLETLPTAWPPGPGPSLASFCLPAPPTGLPGACDLPPGLLAASSLHALSFLAPALRTLSGCSREGEAHRSRRPGPPLAAEAASGPVERHLSNRAHLCTRLGGASGASTSLQPVALLDGTAGFRGQCLPSPSPVGREPSVCIWLLVCPRPGGGRLPE